MSAAREPLLDDETRAYIDRLVDEAPTLSENQKAVIATAFSDAEEEAEAGGAP